MPFNPYRCQACGHAKSCWQNESDPPLTDCPACGKPTFRKWGSAERRLMQRLDALDAEIGFFQRATDFNSAPVVEVSDPALVVEESAILYANGQSEIAEHVLKDAIKADPGRSAPTAWAMMLELYRLTGRRAEFDELAIDYASKFEGSPPTWISIPQDSPHFMMPPVIESPTDELIDAIRLYAVQSNPTILDCARLERVDISATGQLLAGLAPLTGGNRIELINVNWLVLALFNVFGLRDIVKIVPR